MHDNLWKMFSAYKTILKPNPEKSFYVKQVFFKKSWNVLLVLYLYKHSSYDNVSDLSNGAFLYIFFSILRIQLSSFQTH